MQALFSATGDIAAGGQETCNIVNNFVIKEEEEEEFTASTADSHITAQGTTDSSELTALEKITKLKQQWLNIYFHKRVKIDSKSFFYFIR